jgi:hypothetical protein
VSKENEKVEEKDGKYAQIVIEDACIPVKKSEVTIREEMEEDGQFVLFNAENELILVINATGRYILSKCNGEKSVGGIIEDIKKDFAVKEDIDISKVVKEFVSLMLKGELVEIIEKDIKDET